MADRKSEATTLRRAVVLVTGGSGFVGSAIVRALNEKHPEWHICILDKGKDPRAEKAHRQQPVGDGLDLLRGCTYDYVQADITNAMEVMEAMARTKPDAVVHTAGVVPPLTERYLRRLESDVKRVNVNGTRHVVDAASKTGCKALVYTSSCCAVTDDMTHSYPNIDERWPVAERGSIYGESKVEAERIVIAANTMPTQRKGDGSGSADGMADQSIRSSSPQLPMSTCVLRPSVIFGEGDNQLIPPIHACIAKQETRFRIGSGMNLWDTVYVGNVADAHVLAVENLLSSQSMSHTRHANGNGVGSNLSSEAQGEGSAAGETFFIQNNEPISFREFSLAVWKEFGHLPPAVEVPIPEGLAWVLGLMAEVFTRISGTPTTLSRGSVMDACAMRYASGDKARRILGYRPRIGLEAGLKRSCQDYSRRIASRSRSQESTVER